MNPSIYLSICLSVYLSVCYDLFLSITLFYNLLLSITVRSFYI